MDPGSKCKSVKLANRSAVQSLQSAKSKTECSVRFENKTSRCADLLWFNFEGLAVRYCTLPPGTGVNMVTFVGHPWVCRDSNTGDQLFINHSDVFKAVGGTAIGITVMITIPIYTLHERCLQVLSHLLPKDGIKTLEIPETLKDDLLKRYES